VFSLLQTALQFFSVRTAFPSLQLLALQLLNRAENLISHFGKYGTIIDSVIMKDRATGHPRGFGFVTYSNPDVCDLVVLDEHVIDGRTVSYFF
jgi:RNA recognition motif-containing protein